MSCCHSSGSTFAAFLKAPLLPLRQKWQLKFLKSFPTCYTYQTVCCLRWATFLLCKKGGNRILTSLWNCTANDLQSRCNEEGRLIRY